MSTQYILQKNDTWAEYSSISDCIHDYDLTDEEVIYKAGLKAQRQAEQFMRDELDKLRSGIKNQFSKSIKEAVESTIEHCSDKEWVEEVKKLLQE